MPVAKGAAPQPEDHMLQTSLSRRRTGPEADPAARRRAQDVQELRRRRADRPRHARGRILHHRRPVRLRQDHADPHAGRDGQPTYGDIMLRGERINDVPPNKRPTCMVFQSLALFPHRTVGENIEFPLKIRGVEPAERKERALELMGHLLRLPEGLLRQERHQMLRRRTAARGAGPRARLRPGNSVLRRTAVGARLQAAQGRSRRS